MRDTVKAYLDLFSRKTTSRRGDVAELEEFLAEKITGLALWLICRANVTKDRCLASRLKSLAEKYEP